MGPCTLSNALTSNNVTTFVKDNNNQLWIGTNSGLNIARGHHCYTQMFANVDDSTTLPGNTINDLLKDSKGFIWIATDKGLARYEGNYHFHQYINPQLKTNITQICELSNSNIVFIAENKIYYIQQNKIHLFATIHKQPLKWMYSQYKISPDYKGGVWLMAPRFIHHYDKKGHLVKIIQQSKTKFTNVCSITEDKEKIWISQGQNICCLDKISEKLIYTNRKTIPILPWIMLKGSHGTILIQSHKKGLYKFYPLTEKIRKVSNKEFPLYHNDKQISSLRQDSDGTFYIGYRNMGIDIISNEENAIRTLNKDIIVKKTKGKNVSNMTLIQGKLWGAVDDDIFSYNFSTKQYSECPLDNIFNDSPQFRQDFRKIIAFNTKQFFLMTNVRFALCQEKNNHLYQQKIFNPGFALGNALATGDTIFITSDSGKLYYYINNESHYHQLNVKINGYDEKTLLLPISSQKILLLCQNGNAAVLVLPKLEIIPFNWQHNDKLNNILITCAYTDPPKNIWIGTKTHGVLQASITQKSIKEITTGIDRQRITNILANPDGTLEITTEGQQYICQPISKDKTFFKTMTIDRDKENSPINDESIVMLTHKIFAIGTYDGCLLFSNKIPSSHYSSLKLENIEIITNAGNQLTPEKPLVAGSQFVLHHNHNDLQILFKQLISQNSIHPIYSFKLEGVDKQWNSVPKNLIKYYSNLPSGKYILRIHSIGTNINETKSDFTLTILILPPLWFSWQAICLYLLFTFWLVYYINTLYLKNRADKLELSVKERENKQERLSNKMNQRFFANVSHEFRNPLTMIAGPILSMQRDQSLPASTRHSLNIVSLSVRRMLQLIDQMLDFNKLEDDVLRLQVELCDFSEITRIQIEILKETASYHHIQVDKKGLDDPQLLWIDKDKIEKIMSNLFTNALKHTPDGGEISIICQTAKDRKLSISIYNNGKHIPKDKLPYVFARYYQVKEINENHNYGFGTGLGLYYVQQLVKLHHGSISAANVPNGGVVFSLLLPHEDIYSDSEKRKRPVKSSIHKPVPHINFEKFEKPNEDITGLRPTMLVVDDDTDLVLYITSIFDSVYRVKSVYSAESALEYLKNHQPDIILSDVVMNEINGLDFCRILKEDMNYSHIPIVLISAKSNIREQIEGLNVGAIAYIVKPFDPDMLKALVKSQIRNMDEVRKQLRENTSAQIVSDTLSPQDRKFMDEVYTLMEQQLTMENINIPSVCNEMHVSRTKFNYKIKQLTDMTPSTFFRTYKLNRAAKLLRDGECNVSEAAMQTGFNNLSYFSTIFKKQFGISPSEYK
jgi:signal transduction histidine kinase/DNA-binding response OmpR family regulator/ligand-binding sensor domain-containing protein